MPGKHKRWWLAAVCISSMILTGCQIFPEEEEMAPVPVIKSYQIEEYEQTVVMRGDLMLTDSILCEYVPVKKETLSFSVGGIYIDRIYVSEGQEVKAGDLLADLVLDDLDQQILQQEYELEVLSLKKTHLQQDWAVQAARYEIQQDYAGKAEAEAGYNAQLQELKDSIYIQTLRLEDTKKELEKRQLYVGIDGTVTYVKSVAEGARSINGETMITLSDMSTTAFTVTGEDAIHFPIGTSAVIVFNQKEYEAVSVDPAELGLSVEEAEEEIAYLKLEQPDPNIEDGDRGRIEITVDSRQDCLYVNKKAIQYADHRAFVYVLDEEGTKVKQDVTTGLECEKYIEIISGLEAGDNVILEQGVIS